jgi:hypothetical protein
MPLAVSNCTAVGDARWSSSRRRRSDNSAGLPAVPLRWVLIRDPEGGFGPQALLCTDLDAQPGRTFSWLVKRWQMEATFQEIRQRLGFETQRHWSEGAIRTGAPALLWGSSRWLRSSPTVRRRGCRTPCDGRHGTTSLLRPSAMPWRWYARSCGRRRRLFASRFGRPTQGNKARGGLWNG